ncbi:MAG TPA: ABC transporter ATP-binding protein [Rhizomicrobium sp.]|nr:ABC transporter ATP-binding protein [Rhizomicrobium sp.]
MTPPDAPHKPHRPEPAALLEIADLTKDFGGFRAVDGVSFSIRAGEIVGLLGANGAGKSTTVHMLLGFILPSAGRIRLFGLDPLHHREAVMTRVNFMSPYVGFPMRLSVFENLLVYAKLYAVPNARAKIGDLLDLFDIADVANKRYAQLSSGEATRVGLCKAFLNDPDFLILDEPLASLDPRAAVHVKQLLVERQRQRGLTVLLTSHNMFHVEEICRRVIFLDRGRVVADGSPLDVTRTMLSSARTVPALREIFLSMSGRKARESA